MCATILKYYTIYIYSYKTHMTSFALALFVQAFCQSVLVGTRCHMVTGLGEQLVQGLLGRFFPLGAERHGSSAFCKRCNVTAAPWPFAQVWLCSVPGALGFGV